MKINSFFILLFLFSSMAKAQNLVPNPSFESYSECPLNFSQIYEATGWYAPALHEGTPDYYNACALVSSYVNVPNNGAGFEYAATGNAYAGLFLYNARALTTSGHNYREYIETKLIQPLTAGVMYKISLKYSLADSSFFTTNAFGIVLKATSINGWGNASNIHETPQWSATSNLDVTNGWTTLEFNYMAKGGEQYMALGNFKPDTNTPLSKNVHLKTHYTTGISSDYYCYIFLDDISVSCISPPVFHLGKDTLVCYGAQVALQAPLPNALYQWQDGSSASIFTVTQTGVYRLKITDPQTGCFSADTIQVKYKSLQAFSLGQNLVLCEGQTLVLDPVKQADSYLWQDGSTDSTYEVTHQGNYSVFIKNNGCITRGSATVKYNLLPVFDWGNDTLVYGTELVLDAGNPTATYLWQDGSADRFYHVTQDGTYWVKAASPDGCTASDTITIQLSKSALELPNVFTPNHDGVNDTFVPSKTAGIKSLSIEIYNRWGEKVYASSDLNFSWGGEGAPDGVYYWNLRYISLDKDLQDTRNGWLQLLR